MSIERRAGSSDWPRLVIPAAVLLASVAACSAMPPADAGAPMACHVDRAGPWIGRAASATVVEQARLDSRSETVHVVMPGDAAPDGFRLGRLTLFLDDRSIIERVSCG